MQPFQIQAFTPGAITINTRDRIRSRVVLVLIYH